MSDAGQNQQARTLIRRGASDHDLERLCAMTLSDILALRACLAVPVARGPAGRSGPYDAAMRTPSEDATAA